MVRRTSASSSWMPEALATSSQPSASRASPCAVS